MQMLSKESDIGKVYRNQMSGCRASIGTPALSVRPTDTVQQAGSSRASESSTWGGGGQSPVLQGKMCPEWESVNSRSFPL